MTKKDDTTSLKAKLDKLQQRIVSMLPLEQKLSALEINLTGFARQADLGRLKTKVDSLVSTAGQFMKKTDFVTTHEEVTRWSEINVPEKIQKHEQMLSERNFFPIDVTTHLMCLSRLVLQSWLSYYGCLPAGSILSRDSKVKWLEYRSPTAGGEYTRQRRIVEVIETDVFKTLKIRIVELPNKYIACTHGQGTEITAYQLFTDYKEYYMI